MPVLRVVEIWTYASCLLPMTVLEQCQSESQSGCTQILRELNLNCENEVKRRRLINDCSSSSSSAGNSSLISQTCSASDTTNPPAALGARQLHQRWFHEAFNGKVRQFAGSQKSTSSSSSSSPTDATQRPLLDDQHSLDRTRYRASLRWLGGGKFSVQATGFESQVGYPRFARKYGADRFLRVRIEGVSAYRSPKDCRDQLQPFFWLGRKWVCVHSKVDKLDKRKLSMSVDQEPTAKYSHIYFAERMCTPEEEQLCQNIHSPTKCLAAECLQEVCARDVLRSHIPEYVCSSCPQGCGQHFLCRKAGRAANPEEELMKEGKYVKRLDMGWTDAEPTEVFDACDIIERDDLRSSINPCEVLTDGNGLIGYDRAKRISDTLGLTYVPAVFQGRLGCAKGTFTVHYGIDGEKIVLSQKMCKWAIDWAGCDEEDRRLEVKAYPKPESVPQSLNTQYIAVCAAKGVPLQVFADLAKTHIDTLAEETLSECCPGHGLPGYREAAEDKTRLAVKMIDAGIGMSEPICVKWVLDYLVGKTKSIRNEAHYNCPESWHAFIIPDWSQKLLPGECIFEKAPGNFVEGFVSLTRSPCTACWDVQYLRALGPKEIRERFGGNFPPYMTLGVIVLSAASSCERAPAAFMGGGDYDGDKANLNAYAPIVSALNSNGNCAYDASLISDLQRTFGRKARPSCDASSKDPLEAMVHEHYLDSSCAALVGDLGQRWAFFCDSRGAADQAVLRVGLLFQEALDGKLRCDIDGAMICKSMGLPDRLPQPPHWHKKCWLQLQGMTDDADKLEELVECGKVVRSTSALGALFDGVDIGALLSEWRRSGPHHYRFEEAQQRGGVEPHPSLALPPGAWCQPGANECLLFAQKVLEGYFTERGKRKSCTAESVKKLVLDAQKQLFKGTVNFGQRRDRALAFYEAQIQRFNRRVLERKQIWKAESVEFHLEPAWRICTEELCAYAASKDGGVCCVSANMRGLLRFKSSNISRHGSTAYVQDHNRRDR